MHVLILGAAGMVGRKLVDQLCEAGSLAGREITTMTLVDVIEPERPAAGKHAINWAVSTAAADVAVRSEVDALIAHKPDIIFNLAAIVSGEAEMDFDKGYAVNLNGSLNLFEAIRQQNYRPKVVFTSSIAVFGAPFPDAIDDEFLSAPLTSYGVQKACSELLLMDYSRKGFIDGIAIRLPTVVIRPGKPNKAASGFFSSILREPLNGQEAVLPVSLDVRHWMASPRRSAGFLIHAANLDTNRLGARRALSMPGIPVTVGEMIEALERVAGPERAALIRHEPDETITRIVDGWPRNFNTSRALALGFTADSSMDEIIRIYIEEELGGQLG
ncbi:MAG: SDR family oxidoreductase [Rhizobiaceae bacterium]|nr:SDR family oxidoreductase [Rhizobiaceae bacterium]